MTRSPDRRLSGAARRATADRLAFTTLGIPGAPLGDVADLARRTGWLGVELRSADDEPVHVGMSLGEVATARRDLAGLTVIATDSYVRFASTERSDDEVVEAALAEAEAGALARSTRGAGLRGCRCRTRERGVRRAGASDDPSAGDGDPTTARRRRAVVGDPRLAPHRGGGRAGAGGGRRPEGAGDLGHRAPAEGRRTVAGDPRAASAPTSPMSRSRTSGRARFRCFSATATSRSPTMVPRAGKLGLRGLVQPGVRAQVASGRAAAGGSAHPRHSLVARAGPVNGACGARERRQSAPAAERGGSQV